MRSFKRFLCFIICLSFVLSSALPSFAMGFTEDITQGGIYYTEETRYQVFDGVVYDMYWGIPDSIVQLYGLHEVTRYQEYPYWVVFLSGSSTTVSSSWSGYPCYVIQFDYDGNNVPTNVTNCLETIANGGSVSTSMRSFVKYFKGSFIYASKTSSKAFTEHLDAEYNADYGLYGVYAYPKMGNANLYFNDGELMLAAVPSPDIANLGWEDAVIDPTDDLDDFFDDDGNFKDDDTDYGIFSPIINFFKIILYRLKAIYAFIRTINIAIVNALRLVFTDPINSVKTAIEGWQNFFDNFDENMDTWFNNMVSDIGDSILGSIKSIFVPSDGYFEEKVEFLRNKIVVTFGVSAYDMSHIFSAEKSFTDFKINLYGQELTIIDMSYVVDALGTVRPIIRGFITLCLVFYNINQFLLFIGQPAISLGKMMKSVAAADS